jgi:hypothetical protein
MPDVPGIGTTHKKPEIDRPIELFGNLPRHVPQVRVPVVPAILFKELPDVTPETPTHNPTHSFY